MQKYFVMQASVKLQSWHTHTHTCHLSLWKKTHFRFRFLYLLLLVLFLLLLLLRALILDILISFHMMNPACLLAAGWLLTATNFWRLMRKVSAKKINIKDGQRRIAIRIGIFSDSPNWLKVQAKTKLSTCQIKIKFQMDIYLVGRQRQGSLEESQANAMKINYQ